VEGLVGERWVGRYWTADGRINVPYELYADDAFELQIESQWLSTGWRWVNANEATPTRPGQRHFVVELSNRLSPVRLKVHTELDGTPVLVRWLELSNSSRKPIALTAVYPWSARLWRSRDYRASLAADASEPVFRLGYFNQISHGWEGWFQWFPLKNQTERIRYDVGHGANDPFFIVRNEAEGESFIGHLAWTANWEMEFKSEGEPANFGSGREPLNREANLHFKIGPCARASLRVLAPGETIQTPAVHLGHVEGDLDYAVQAMHEHIRRSVLPSRNLELSYLIQYAVPGDQGYIARKHGDLEGMNEKNLQDQIDLAAAIACRWVTVAGPAIGSTISLRQFRSRHQVERSSGTFPSS
jgi:alpha-galactosidase